MQCCPDPGNGRNVSRSECDSVLRLTHCSFRIAPPLTISDDEIAEGISIMDEAFDFCIKRKAHADAALVEALNGMKMAP